MTSGTSTHSVPTVRSDRYLILDSIRGIASFAVVLFHLGGTEHFTPSLSWIVQRAEVGVQVFFVLSGYVIYQSIERHIAKGHKGAVIFLGKRARRIYPAFLASLGFALIANYLVLSQTISLPHVSAIAVLVYPYFNIEPPQVIYWTLVLEQQFYLIMAFLMLPFVRKARMPLLLGSTLVVIVVQYGMVSNWYVNSTVISHWYEFLLGILVYVVIHNRKWRIASSIVLCYLIVSGLLGGLRMQAAGIAAMLLLLLYPFDLAISRSKLQAPFAWLGKISYSLYLVHLPVILLSYAALESSFGLSFFAAYFVELALILIVASLFYFLFERSFMSSKHRPRESMKEAIEVCT